MMLPKVKIELVKLPKDVCPALITNKPCGLHAPHV